MSSKNKKFWSILKRIGSPKVVLVNSLKVTWIITWGIIRGEINYNMKVGNSITNLRDRSAATVALVRALRIETNGEAAVLPVMQYTTIFFASMYKPLSL